MSRGSLLSLLFSNSALVVACRSMYFLFIFWLLEEKKVDVIGSVLDINMSKKYSKIKSVYVSS